MFKRSRLIWISLILFVSTASAEQSQCDGLLAGAASDFKANLQNNPQVIDALADLNVVTKYLNLDLFDLKINGMADKADVDFKTQTLNFPAAYFQKDASAASEVFRHEYSHAIFETYMTANLPEWTRIEAELKEADQIRRDLVDQKNKISFDFKMEQEEKRKSLADLDAKIDVAEAKYQQVRSKKKLQKTIKRSYHEFFADLVPVLLASKKNAMRDSLYS